MFLYGYDVYILFSCYAVSWGNWFIVFSIQIFTVLLTFKNVDSAIASKKKFVFSSVVDFWVPGPELQSQLNEPFVYPREGKERIKNSS